MTEGSESTNCNENINIVFKVKNAGANLQLCTFDTLVTVKEFLNYHLNFAKLEYMVLHAMSQSGLGGGRPPPHTDVQ